MFSILPVIMRNFILNVFFVFNFQIQNKSNCASCLQSSFKNEMFEAQLQSLQGSVFFLFTPFLKCSPLPTQNGTDSPRNPTATRRATDWIPIPVSSSPQAVRRIAQSPAFFWNQQLLLGKKQPQIPDSPLWTSGLPHILAYLVSSLMPSSICLVFYAAFLMLRDGN